MATIIIAKNNTASEVFWEDLGMGVLASSQETLTDIFNKTEISNSKDLDASILVGNITINDGTHDLSIVDGVRHVNFETEYEDTEELLAHTHVEADITDLSHDALTINGIEISSIPPTDAQSLVYDSTSDSFIFDTPTVGVAIGENPTDADPGTIWVEQDTSSPFILDYISGDWLSTGRIVYTFNAQTNIDGAYLPIGIGGVISYYIPRAATITSLYCKATAGNDTKTFYIRDNVTELYTFSFDNSYLYIDNVVRININEGAELRIFVSDEGIPVKDPIIQLEVAWRYV